MCQTGSRICAADGIDIDQLHYLNAECPFWVFNIYFYGFPDINISQGGVATHVQYGDL